MSSLGSNSHHLQVQISPDLMEGAQEIGTMAFWVESMQGKEGTGAISSGTPAQVGAAHCIFKVNLTFDSEKRQK